MASTNISISGIGLFDGIKSMLAGGAPDWVKAFLRGPASTIRISGEATDIEPCFLSFLRPVDIYLDDANLMRFKSTLPVEARTDLPSALCLELEDNLPFEADELLVAATLVGSQNGQDRFEIIAAPKALVGAALEAFGIPTGKVRAIYSGRTASHRQHSFSWPTPTGTKWMRFLGTALPVLLIVASTFWYTQLSLSRQSEVLFDQATEISTRTDQLNALSNELDQLVTQRDAANLLAAEQRTSSTFLSALDALRLHLPQSVSISRLDFRGGSVRLGIEAPNVLDILAGLTNAMPEWSVSVQGAIAADVQRKSERATLIMTRTDSGGDNDAG